MAEEPKAEMQPTLELRWLFKRFNDRPYVLQQLWVGTDKYGYPDEEWRDVPTVNEEDAR